MTRADGGRSRRGPVGGVVGGCGLRCDGALSLLLGGFRQGRGLARIGRRRRDPAPARVPRVRPAVHHLRAARAHPADGAEALGGHRAVRPREAGAGPRPGGRGAGGRVRGGRGAGRGSHRVGRVPGPRDRERRDRRGGAGAAAARSIRSRTCGSRRSTRASRISPTSRPRWWSSSGTTPAPDLASIPLEKTTAPKTPEPERR